tara:strand:- start:3083 stop:3400 length:318 start_codon:yes stop_codon:yes gene_type:complete
MMLVSEALLGESSGPGSDARQEDLQEDLRVFRRHHPYHNDLDFIDGRRRTLVGRGDREEISPKRAAQLVRAKVVTKVEGPFGTELELTSKGRKSLGNSRDAFERL